MIKIIERGTQPQRAFHYRITCTNCKTIFDCDVDDCGSKVVAQGFIAHAIHCPVCRRICYDWQGGCDKWSVIHD